METTVITNLLPLLIAVVILALVVKFFMEMG